MNKKYIIKEFVKDVLISVIGGFLLYIPLIISGYSIYIPFIWKNIKLSFALILALGITIAVTTILVNSTAPRKSFIRATIMMLVCIIVLGSNAPLHRYIDFIFHIPKNEDSGNASGLLMLLFISTITIACLVVIIILAIRKKLGDGSVKTGDGSVS